MALVEFYPHSCITSVRVPDSQELPWEFANICQYGKVSQLETPEFKIQVVSASLECYCPCAIRRASAISKSKEHPMAHKG
jgi:hypothetical protein